MNRQTYERPAIAGSGAIAIGLATTATLRGETILLARSEGSAERARAGVDKLSAKLEGADPSRLTITTDPADLAGCDLIVEAIVEELETKVGLLAGFAESNPDADLASTTSSLQIGEIGSQAGIADRFYGLHVFNPVTRMELIELVLPEGLRDGIAERARTFCEALGKHAVEVPDTAGFVVNRLLFPYLFDAVRVADQLGLAPAEVDACMSKGAGQPMGPLGLLDFIGLDVSKAIGDRLYAASGEPTHAPPEQLVALVEAGKLGRKSGAGFHDYSG